MPLHSLSGWLPGGGVQGVKQPVIGGNSRAGQMVQQGGFACVGIAHDGHHRDGVLHPPLPLDGPHLTHLLQLLLQTVDALADVAAVALQFGFAGAAGTDAAALPGKADAHAGKPGQKILILGQFDLQPALPGLCPLGEDVEDQRAAVEYRHAQNILQGPDLACGELVVKNGHGGCRGLDQQPHLLGLALADEGVGVGSVAVLQDFRSAEAACRLQQRLQLLQRLLGGRFMQLEAVGVQTDQHCPLYNVFFKISFHYLPLEITNRRERRPRRSIE